MSRIVNRRILSRVNSNKLLIQPNYARLFSSHSNSTRANPNASKWWQWGLAIGATAVGASVLLNQNSMIYLANQKDPISLQKEQVAKFRNQIEVYLWGDNSNLLVSPENSNVEFYKTPQPFQFFQGCALRDLKLGKTHAVAVDVNGDVYQWGRGFFGDKAVNYTPERTLAGLNVSQVEVTHDKVILLTKSGHLYMLPGDRTHLYPLPKNDEKSAGWFGSSPSNKECVELKLPNMGWGESIASLSSGNHHIALVTSSGRLLTLATDPEGASFGQTGARSAEVYKFIEPKFLDDTLKFDKVACGSNHTIAGSRTHRIFGFGMNDLGQLGLGDFTLSKSIILEPIELPNLNTKVASIHLGGNTSVINAGNQLMTFGFGQYGQLGHGHYPHFKTQPQVVQQLSNKFYWDEATKSKIGLTFKKISLGNNHGFIVVDNHAGNGNEWGRTVYAIGRNQCGQLGNDKRSNSASPTLIPGIVDGTNALHLQLVFPSKLQVKDGQGKSHTKVGEGAIVGGWDCSECPCDCFMR